jgi:exosortase
MRFDAQNKWPIIANLLFLVVLWGGFLRVFFPEWQINEQYGYGLFVPFLCAYLIYLRSEDRPPPDKMWRGFFCVFIILGTLPLLPLQVILGANPEWRLALWLYAVCTLVATMAVVGCWGGWPWFRHYLSSFILMLLAVPWPTFIENPLTQNLMRLVARVTVDAMNLLGYYAEPIGNLIQLSNGYVGVEEACSGVRSLQSTLMAAYFFGVLFRWAIHFRVILIFVGVLVSLILNFGRTFSLTILMATRGPEAMNVLHDPIGNVVSYGSFAVLFVLTWMVHRWFLRGVSIRKTYWAFGKRDPNLGSPWLLFPTTVYFILASMLAWYWYAASATTSAERILSDVDWRKISYDLKQEEIPPTVRNILRFSEGKQAVWRDSGNVHWTAFFFYWQPGAVSSHVTVHRPEVCLPSAGFRFESSGADIKWEQQGLEIEFNTYVFRMADRRYYVYFGIWDSIPGSAMPIGSDWRDRLQHAWNGRRVEGRYSLQIVLTGEHLNEASAERRFKDFLERALIVDQ